MSRNPLPRGNARSSPENGVAARPGVTELKIQHFTECWKQLCLYFSLARTKHFSSDEEIQFLEIKSVIVQELETVLVAVHCDSPGREAVHEMICKLISLHDLSRLSEGSLRNLENQWHQIYIRWHAALGQTKAHRIKEETRTRRRGMFGWS